MTTREWVKLLYSLYKHLKLWQGTVKLWPTYEWSLISIHFCNCNKHASSYNISHLSNTRTGFVGASPSDWGFGGTMEWTPKFRNKSEFHFYFYSFRYHSEDTQRPQQHVFSNSMVIFIKLSFPSKFKITDILLTILKNME